jgi:hypothetical protein
VLMRVQEGAGKPVERIDVRKDEHSNPHDRHGPARLNRKVERDIARGGRRPWSLWRRARRNGHCYATELLAANRFLPL